MVEMALTSLRIAPGELLPANCSRRIAPGSDPALRIRAHGGSKQLFGFCGSERVAASLIHGLLTERTKDLTACHSPSLKDTRIFRIKG